MPTAIDVKKKTISKLAPPLSKYLLSKNTMTTPTVPTIRLYFKRRISHQERAATLTSCSSIKIDYPSNNKIIKSNTGGIRVKIKKITNKFSLPVVEIFDLNTLPKIQVKV